MTYISIKKSLLAGAFGLAAISVQAQSEPDFKYAVKEKLPETINTRSDEMLPFLSADGQKIYFIRTVSKESNGQKMQTLWYSEKGKDGQWQEAKETDAKLNETVRGIGANGKELYFARFERQGDDMVAKLYKATVGADGSWSDPVEMNSDAIKTSPSYFGLNVSPNGQYMILTMEGSGTNKLEDLYVSKKEGNTWTAPKSLGSTINKEGSFETSPFLSSDNKTLYFASNKPGGQGDADLYMTKRLDESWQKWSEPVNLGKGVNSNGFEGYLYAANNGDIYLVSEESGSRGQIYKLGYREPEPPVVQPTPPSEPIKPVKPVVKPLVIPSFENVYFDYNKHNLNPAGKMALDKVAEFMDKNQNTTVKIEGHTDRIGTDQRNMVLSEEQSRVCQKVSHD